jgi:dimethylhistidine N-methyltransferase
MREQQRQNELQELESELGSEFAADVLVGLSSPKKYLASKYFYDKTGSELFEQICLQPEYYLTRVETSILKENAPEIASTVLKRQDQNSEIFKQVSIVELGSGNSTKTRILLSEFLDKCTDVHYFPIDISHKTLALAVESLRSDFSKLSITGMPMDYNSGLERINRLVSAHDAPKSKLILFLGSSIGNFEPKQAVSFLRMLRQKMCLDDYLLIGFDLQKETSILDAAYNDKEAVTARFNVNLLKRINAELEGQFELEQFAHRAFYNEQLGRIEMHLESLANQEVQIGRLKKSFNFKLNETIHTENSYKYSLDMIDRIATQSGLVVHANFEDEKSWFVLSLLRSSG